MDKILSREEMEHALVARHTKAVQDKLRAARVAILGLGGLGSNVAVMLARLGVGHLHLIDFDRVDTSNLNRQQYMVEYLGEYKTKALQEELTHINPYVEVAIDTVRVTAENAADLVKNEDIVCEAFDKPDQKAMLVDAILTLTDKKLVCGSGMAGYGSANTIRTRKLSDRFFICGDGTSDSMEGTPLMAPRVAICAAHEANMILRLILGIKAE